MINYELIVVPPGQFEWRELPYPVLEPDEVLVNCRYGAIKHGTEFSMIKGTAAARGRWNSELRLHERAHRGDRGNVHEIDHKGGHEKLQKRTHKNSLEKDKSIHLSVGNMVCGEVAAVGSAVTEFALGDSVYGYSSFANYTSIHQTRLWKLSSADWKSALCLDPARFALAAIRDSNLRLGDSLAVFGLGAIGLITVKMARLAGVSQIFGIDPISERRKVAKKLGATKCFDPEGFSPESLSPVGSNPVSGSSHSSVDIGYALKTATGGLGVDSVIELSGAAAALQAGLRGVAFGGTVVCAAFPAPYSAGLDFGAEAHMNRPKIVFSRAVSDPNRDHPRWDIARIEKQCRVLITEGQLLGEGVIDKVVPYSDLKSEYKNTMDDPSRAIKLGVDFKEGKS